MSCINNNDSAPWVNTLEKHLWQRLQLRVFLGMSVSALHIWIWGFSPILPCRFAQALSSWMGSIGEQQSSSLSTDTNRDSSLGFGWATQGLSHSCSEAISVLLWLYAWGHCPDWNVNICRSLRCFALWSRFSSRIYLHLALFIVSAIFTSLPVPAAEKHPHSMMLPAKRWR